MKSRNQLDRWDIIPLAICVFLCSSQLKVWLPFAKPLAVMGIGLLYSIACYHKFYQSKHLIWLFVYAVILILNSLSGDTYFKLITNVIEELFLLVIPAALCFYIIQKQKYVLAKYLVVSICLLIIYSTITTFIVDTIFPDAVRTSVFLSNMGESALLNYYYGMGMVAYRFPHALPIIIPALVFILRNRQETKYFKILAAATLFAILFVIYLSNAATPLFVALLVLIMSIIATGRNSNNSIVKLGIMFVVFILLFFHSDIVVEFLDYVGSLLGGDTKVYSDRFEDLQAYSSQGSSTGDVGSRVIKYDISISLIVESLFLGSNEPTGQHSAILDRLACLGLVGWIPYMVYIFNSIKKIGGLLRKKLMIYYYLGVCAGLLILALKNMSNWDTWLMLFCVLPLMLWVSMDKLPQDKDVRTRIVNKK